MPGEKDPTQAISTCPYCNSCVDQKATVCQSCKQVMTPNQGQPHPRKVPQKGERYDDYGRKFDYINKGTPIAASKQAGRRDKKDKNHAEHDKDTVRDSYLSDEFSMCYDLGKKSKNDDVRKEEIMRSCTDLAIDG